MSVAPVRKSDKCSRPLSCRERRGTPWWSNRPSSMERQPGLPVGVRREMGVLLMHKLLVVAIALTIVASGMPPWRGSAQTTRSVAQRPPLVSVVDAPPGTEKLGVQWVRIADADLGVMLAAVARPSGPGPHPVVVVLHGTHGFAHEYVQWAHELARGSCMAQRTGLPMVEASTRRSRWRVSSRRRCGGTESLSRPTIMKEAATIPFSRTRLSTTTS